jgi:hypothetical protein
LGSSDVMSNIADGVGNLFGGNPADEVPGALVGPAPAKAKPPTPINPTVNSIQSQVNDLARRRASTTLFTGGQGLLEKPSVASAVLLGR